MEELGIDGSLPRKEREEAIGHLEAVKRMVDQDADCSDVLIQLAAVRSAINNTAILCLPVTYAAKPEKQISIIK